MVNYRMFKAQGVLSQFVRFFWNLEARVDATHPFIHRAMPDNCVELIFYCKGSLSISSSYGDEGNTFPSGVFGQAQKFRQFRTSSDFCLFGVYLYPYTLKALFNIPARLTCNEMIDSETLWGLDGKVLEERVMLASNVEQRIQLVSNFFLDRVRKFVDYDQRFMLRIKSVVDNNSLLAITDFADGCNLSRRQFERKFNEYSGFSPKGFFGIVRFKNVLKEAGEERPSLAKIAVDSGYYDQSHFTNEFKKLSGYSPREFFLHYPKAIDGRATRDFKS